MIVYTFHNFYYIYYTFIISKQSFMKTKINNYKVSSLLISQDYICIDQQNNPMLLCNTRSNLMLSNYRTIVINNVIFPVELTCVGQQYYYAYPLSNKMIHCVTKIKSFTYSQNYLMKTMKKLNELVIEIKDQKYLKEQILSCLHVDNLWLTKSDIYIIWNPRQKKQNYSDELVIAKLGSIFYFLMTGNLYQGVQDINFITNKNVKGFIYNLLVNKQIKMTFQMIRQFFINNQYVPLINPRKLKKKQKIHKQVINMDKKFAQEARIYLNQKKPWFSSNQKIKEFISLQKQKIDGSQNQKDFHTIVPSIRVHKRRSSNNKNTSKRYFQNFKESRKIMQPMNSQENTYFGIKKKLEKEFDNEFGNYNDVDLSQIMRRKPIEDYDKEINLTYGYSNLKDKTLLNTLSKQKQQFQHTNKTKRNNDLNEEDFYTEKAQMKLLSWNRKFMEYKQRTPLTLTSNRISHSERSTQLAPIINNSTKYNQALDKQEWGRIKSKNILFTYRQSSFTNAQEQKTNNFSIQKDYQNFIKEKEKLETSPKKMKQPQVLQIQQFKEKEQQEINLNSQKIFTEQMIDQSKKRRKLKKKIYEILQENKQLESLKKQQQKLYVNSKLQLKQQYNQLEKIQSHNQRSNNNIPIKLKNDSAKTIKKQQTYNLQIIVQHKQYDKNKNSLINLPKNKKGSSNDIKLLNTIKNQKKNQILDYQIKMQQINLQNQQEQKKKHKQLDIQRISQFEKYQNNQNLYSQFDKQKNQNLSFQNQKLDNKITENEEFEKYKRENEKLQKQKQNLEKLKIQRLEKQKLEKQKLQKEKLENQRLQNEKVEKEKQKNERHEKQKLEKEQLEKEKLQKQGLEKEKLEKERLEKQKLEKEQLEKEKLQKQQLEKEKLEKEQLEKEKLQNERLEKEKLEKEQLEKEKLQNERLEKEKLEKEQLEKEKLQNERLEKEKLEKEQLEKEKLQKQGLEKEKLEKERLEKQKLEKEQLEKEKLQNERLEKEKLEKERLEKQKLEKEQLEKEKLQKQRLEKEKLEKEQLEKEKLQNERLEKEKQKELSQKQKILYERLQKIQQQLFKKKQQQELKKKQEEQERIQKQKQKQQALMRNNKQQINLEKNLIKITPQIISKKVEQYIDFINLLGEACGKSKNIVKKIPGLQWFPAIYFVYKRFLKERIKIQKSLKNGENKFSRSKDQLLDQQTFNNWLLTQERFKLYEKLKRDNRQIDKALNKMYQKLIKQNKIEEFLQYAPINIQHEQQIILTVELILDEYDQLILLENRTHEINLHIVQMLDCLFILAELDGKACSQIDLIKRREMKNLEQYLKFQQLHLEQITNLYLVQK